MKNTKSLIILLLIFIYILIIPTYGFLTSEDINHDDTLKLSINDKFKDKTAFKMYECLEKYSTEYEIPKHVFYNLAYLETRYKGPYDLNYKHNLVSRAGALGPMQIMPSTAKFICKKSVSKQRLKNDVDFNVEISAKLLNLLYKKYNNWSLACGYYNTGRPIINKYAKYCVSNIDYQNKWDAP